MQAAKHIEKSVPPQAAKLEGETSFVPTYENKKVSTKITFQDCQTGDLSRVPGLPDLPMHMPGCQNPCQAPFQETSVDRVRESTRKFRQSLMYSLPALVREQTVDSLNLLIRFDKAVTMEESRILMEAVKIITAKGLPA